jgi:protein SCO1/2
MIHTTRRQMLVAAGAALLAGRTLAAAGEATSAQTLAKLSARSVEPLPSKSVYQLAVPLTDQNGKAFQLADERGTPTVVSMFYTSCQFTCPMLIEAMRANEEKLAPAERARLKVLLVSFDPEHDTVAALRKTADAHGVDGSRWSLVRSDATSVRKLAALLGIQYRAIGNGDFNHTAALILLDGDGQVVARTGEVTRSDDRFVKELKRAVAASAS